MYSSRAITYLVGDVCRHLTHAGLGVNIVDACPRLQSVNVRSPHIGNSGNTPLPCAVQGQVSAIQRCHVVIPPFSKIKRRCPISLSAWASGAYTTHTGQGLYVDGVELLSIIALSFHTSLSSYRLVSLSTYLATRQGGTVYMLRL
jgi:hypothetical protein